MPTVGLARSLEDKACPSSPEVCELIRGTDKISSMWNSETGVGFQTLTEKGSRADCCIRSGAQHHHLVFQSLCALAYAKQVNPSIRTGILYSAGLYEPWEYAKGIGADALHPNHHSVVPFIVKEHKSTGSWLTHILLMNPRICTGWWKPLWTRHHQPGVQGERTARKMTTGLRIRSLLSRQRITSTRQDPHWPPLSPILHAGPQPCGYLPFRMRYGHSGGERRNGSSKMPCRVGGSPLRRCLPPFQYLKLVGDLVVRCKLGEKLFHLRMSDH